MRLSKSFGKLEGLSYDLVCLVWLVAMGGVASVQREKV